MTKRYDEQQLLDYIEGNLTSNQRARIEESLRDQPELRAYLEAMIGDRQAIAALPEPDAPSWIMDEVDRRIERTMLLDGNSAELEAVTHRQRSVLRRLTLVGGLAAMVLITGMIVGYSLWGFGDSRLTGTSVVMDQQPEPDGSNEIAKGGQPDVTTHVADSQAANVRTGAIAGKGGSRSRTVGSVAQARPTVSKFDAAGAQSPESFDMAQSANVQELVDSAANDTGMSGAMVSKMGPVAEDANFQTDEHELIQIDPLKAAEALIASQPGIARTWPLDVQALGQSGAEVDLTNDRPMGDNVEIVVQTEDLPRSVKQLNFVVDNNSAKLEELPQMVAKASKTATTTTTTVKRYNITVPEEQLPELVRQLKEPLNNGYQRAFVNSIETTTTTVTTQRTFIVRRLRDGNAWPQDNPDYGQIVSEQLPLGAADTMQGVQASRRITVPVTLETVPSEVMQQAEQVAEPIIDQDAPNAPDVPLDEAQQEVVTPPTDDAR